VGGVGGAGGEGRGVRKHLVYDQLMVEKNCGRSVGGNSPLVSLSQVSQDI